MKISKIKSFYSLNQLFSFITENRKFKIIKYNMYLNQKLYLSANDYKEFFFLKKINKYNNYRFINNYYIEFKNEFGDIIDEDLFLNVLSKKKDFILNIKDKDFKLIINNKYFKENPRFEIEGMNKFKYPKILLMKENKLTNKAINTFKKIFDLFSNNGKMSKQQSIDFFQNISQWDINYRVKELFKYDKDKNGFLLFEDFINYYYDLIKKNLNKVWKDLEKLGYNNYLNENYGLEYLKNKKDEFEESILLSNFFKSSQTLFKSFLIKS